MGMVLPHGGIDAKEFAAPNLEWVQGHLLLVGLLWAEVNELEANFVGERNSCGYFASGPLMIPLILMGSPRSRRLQWRLCMDAVRPPGFPAYFLTESTADALQRARQLSPDTLLIDERAYRLHGGCFEGMHIAMLMRAKP